MRNLLKSPKSLCLLALLCLTAGSTLLFAQQQRQLEREEQRRIRELNGRWCKQNNELVRCGMIHELGMRARMTHTVIPSYPEDAIRDGAQGQVIAAVRFDENGELAMIHILRSPHPLISRAVIDAVQQWRGRRLFTVNREPVALQSELRFNFVIENGAGRVEDSRREEQGISSREYWAFMTRWTTEDDRNLHQ